MLKRRGIYRRCEVIVGFGSKRRFDEKTPGTVFVIEQSTPVLCVNYIRFLSGKRSTVTDIHTSTTVQRLIIRLIKDG